MPVITVIDSLDYTTRPLSLQHTTNGGYVTVYTPQGEFLSRHTSVEEATESIVRHASAVEMTEDTAEVVYKIILPEKHVSILLRRANSTYGPGEVDVTPPSAPTAGFLSNLTANSTRVNWTNAGDNDIDYTRVYKSTVSSSTFFTLVAQVDYPTNSYTDTINPAQQVWYRVSHVDNAGNESAFSSVFTDITAPTTPAAPTVSQTTSTSVTLTLPATTSFDHASWRVYRSAAGGSTADTLVASGVTGTSYSVTGLSPQTSYAFAVQAVDASGNASATGATVTQQTSAEGDNATRINALLAGRAPHFSYSTPNDPVTTRQETVTTATAFNNAANISGTRIIINQSFSGDVQIRANDIDVVMSNSATITGNLTFGGPSYCNRVRWTGGNVNGRFMFVRANDVLIDDFYVYVAGTSANAPHDLTAGGQGFSRVALINSTFEVTAPANSDNWALYVGQNAAHNNMIIGNVKVISAGQNNRFNSITNFLLFDCAFNPNGGPSSGLRMHYSCTNVWMKECWWRDFAKLDAVNTSDTGPSVLNAVFEDNAHYDNNFLLFAIQSGSGINTPNTGTVRNHTMHWSGGAGSFPSVSPLTAGSGNTRVAWDGSTVPDYSTVGAVR